MPDDPINSSAVSSPKPKDANCTAAKRPITGPHKRLAISSGGQALLRSQAATMLAPPTIGTALNKTSAGACTCQTGQRIAAIAMPPAKISSPEKNQATRLKMYRSRLQGDQAG